MIDYGQVAWLTLLAVGGIIFIAASAGMLNGSQFQKGDMVHIIHSPLPPAKVIDVKDHAACLQFAEYPQATLWVDEWRLESA